MPALGPTRRRATPARPQWSLAGTLSITDTTMTGNTGGHWTNVSIGSITNLRSAVGTNCKSITVQNSTIQDYP